MNREMLYQQHILDHATRPRNTGVCTHATHQARGTNASCGDVITFYLRVERGVIACAKYEGVGCALSQAAASLLTERVTGMNVRDARVFGESDVYVLLGITISTARKKCALLAWCAFCEALAGRV